MLKKRSGKKSEQELLEKFESDIARGLEVLDDLENIEAVVGILFDKEEYALPAVVQTARLGLKHLGLAGRALVLMAGPESAQELLDAGLDKSAPNYGVEARGFLMKSEFKGRGWGACALMKGASRFGAPMVFLPADIIPQPDESGEGGQGFSPLWISSLLEPIRNHGQDLALARFNHHPLTHTVESFLTFPIVTGVFAFRLRQPTPCVFSLSNRLIQACIAGADIWSRETGAYGLDPWLVMHALAENFYICQVPLGFSPMLHGMGNLKPVFHQVAHSLLTQVVIHARWWLERSDVVSAPATFGPIQEIEPPPYDIEPEELFRIFKHEFTRFNETLFKAVVPERLRKKMEKMAQQDPPRITLTAGEWVEALKGFLLVYGFEHRFHPDDIVDGLFPFFIARLAGFIDEVKSVQTSLKGIGFGKHISDSALMRHEAEHIFDRQTDLFVASRPDFRGAWKKREMEATSYLPRLGAWEFVPNVGVIVPQVIEKEDGTSVWASEAYQELIDRYRKEFTSFISEHLNIKQVEDSPEILRRVKNFMYELEKTLKNEMSPARLSTPRGALKMAERVLELIPGKDKPDGTHPDSSSFQLTQDAARVILKQLPPGNLITQLGCGNVASLLNEFDPRDALAAAAVTEFSQYMNRTLDFLENNGSRDWFHLAKIKPVSLQLEIYTSDTELRGTSALTHLTGRIIAGRLKKGDGGDFPGLWLFLALLKSLAGVVLFSKVWQNLDKEGPDPVPSITKCIRNYWGRHVLSAHHAFENLQHCFVAQSLMQLAKNPRRSTPDKFRAAGIIRAAAGVYHLSITLPDTTFVPLSAWTWAGYSYQGGLGAPTPLFSVVERDWATRDFLTSYIERAGLGDKDTVDKKILALVSQGRASENLRRHLLGVSADPDRLVVTQAPRARHVPAGKLIRLSEKPILEPIPGHFWESRYVLNPAAVRLDGKIYILYRAFGDDKVSRIGLAWTADGVHIDGRLDYPIFESREPAEAAGCEDPRVTVIGEYIYMLYTAWDKELPQIAMASIPVEAFLKQQFDLWERNGLGFPGLSNKDAVLYPEKFDGQYVIYHRINPNLWISYLGSLTCPWPRTGQKIVAGPRAGMMWDGVKIGAGAPPIKTKYGWLNIYHGVDFERTYRLGVLLMAPDDPSKVLYHSPNSILEPQTGFEKGDAGGRDYWVPRVVFTCGAVPLVMKDCLDLDDEIIVYYGAADTVIGAAKSKLGDLVPVFE